MPIGQKLLNLREYHRPSLEGGDLRTALELMARAGLRTVPLAGGDTLLGSGDQEVDAVVDLQGLGLDTINVPGEHAVQIGAMVTRTALGDAWQTISATQAVSDGDRRLLLFLGRAAHAWSGSVQRNRATVGGAVAAAASNDPLVAALLACDTSLALETLDGTRHVTLRHFLDNRAEQLGRPSIITAVTVPSLIGAGYALQTVGRTPSDAPIVLAATRVTRERADLVLGGGSSQAQHFQIPGPLNVEQLAAAANAIAATLSPRGDFRGSTEYRRAMAQVLSRRVLVAAFEGLEGRD